MNTFDGITPLGVAVPPAIEYTLGYRRRARLVGFFWEAAGDELRVADGQLTHDGEWGAWLLLVEHPVMEGELRPYRFGSSDEPAQHMLLLDTQERRWYAGALAAGYAALRAQHPTRTNRETPHNDITNGAPRVQAASFGQWQARRDTEMAALKQWLDSVQPPPSLP